LIPSHSNFIAFRLICPPSTSNGRKDHFVKYYSFRYKYMKILIILYRRYILYIEDTCHGVWILRMAMNLVKNYFEISRHISLFSVNLDYKGFQISLVTLFQTLIISWFLKSLISRTPTSNLTFKPNTRV
jgi:hypothetical protein